MYRVSRRVLLAAVAAVTLLGLSASTVQASVTQSEPVSTTGSKVLALEQRAVVSDTVMKAVDGDYCQYPPPVKKSPTEIDPAVKKAAQYGLAAAGARVGGTIG